LASLFVVAPMMTIARLDFGDIVFFGSEAQNS